MTRTWKRQAAGLGLAGCLFLGLVVANAGAVSTLDEAQRLRQNMVQKIVELRNWRHERRLEIGVRIEQGKRRLAKVTRLIDDSSLRGSVRHDLSKQHDQLLMLRSRRTHLVKAIHAHIHRLWVMRRALADWIDENAIFRYCPVNAPHTVADNFGVIVDIPGVPKHIHQGNDISAAAGAPIVATFDGMAVATRNDLGGLAVDVYGALGHVYNAHLSSYGKLGPVNAGDVIGYVGTTGDATSPHDHFEWHPNDGAAVDPNPLLMTVC